MEAQQTKKILVIPLSRRSPPAKISTFLGLSIVVQLSNPFSRGEGIGNNSPAMIYLAQFDLILLGCYIALYEPILSVKTLGPLN